MLIDSYTKLLLQCNGTDTSTRILDETGKAVTVGGNAQLSTAQYKFGLSSVLFDGAGDYLYLDDSADWAMGSGNFTVDFFTMLNTINTRMCFFGQNDSSGTTGSTSFCIQILATNIIYLYIVSGTTAYEISSTGVLAQNGTWYHIALVRDTNTLRLFINGTADGTKNITGVTMNDSGNKLAIGRMGEYNGYDFKGWIDEFRISKGIARWTSNFTPSSKPYYFRKKIIMAA